MALRSSGTDAQFLRNMHCRRYVKFQLTFKTNFMIHIKPIIMLFASAIALTIYLKSDIVILGFYKTDAEVGIYTVASKIYSIVKAVINAAIMVVIPRLSHCLAEKMVTEYNRILNWLYQVIILLVFPVTIGCIILNYDIMYIIGGNEFTSGGGTLVILAISLFFAVSGCFYSQAIMIPNNRENEFLKATIISAITNAVLNYIFIPTMGINGAAVTTLIAEIIIFVACEKYAEAFWKPIKFRYRHIIIGCFIVMFSCLIVRKKIESSILRILICTVIGAIEYFVVLCKAKNEIVMNYLYKLKMK